MIVIADTAPLHYLVLIDQDELLPALYTRVFLPEAVLRELSATSAPAKLTKWLARLLRGLRYGKSEARASRRYRPI